jgi:FkbM family methyltransferase
MIWVYLARIYGHIVFFMHKHFNIPLPGLGFLCRKIKFEHTINVRGRKYYFYPKAASRYSLLIYGRFPEPETHCFFSKVIPKMNARLGFVDVGAAVGEMVIDAAGYENVESVTGFEPDEDLVKSCRLSAAINEYDKVTIIPKAVAEKAKKVNFKFTRGKGMSGSISEEKTSETEEIVCTTLDNEIQDDNYEYLVLIDVEGAEPLVLSGGREFIKRKRPLIIFEYNNGEHYQLSEISTILGPDYKIYRLKDGGFLDDCFDDVWNCVAVNKNSVFYPVCQSIIQK